VVEPWWDWTGTDALRVTIVIPDSAAGKIDGEQGLNMLGAVQDRLQRAGEDRFAYIHYATESELKEDANAEP
jgi:hypothetical protein